MPEAPFAPRTSSLPPKQQEKKQWTISNLTTSLYKQAINASPPLWSDSDDENEPQLQNRKSFTEIDSQEVRMLLDQLNNENAKLVLNPKSVIANNGSIQMKPATLQSLTSFYSNHAPVTMDDPSVIEFWNHFLLYDPMGQVTKVPHLIVAKTRAAPIPPHLRAQVWCRLCGVEPNQLLNLYNYLQSQTSPMEKIIERDIGRTFPQSDMFKEDGGQGQLTLFRVLKAYSLYDTEVGYCQGLSFCVGPLLMQRVRKVNKMSEVEAFGVLLQIMGRSPTQSFPFQLERNLSNILSRKFSIRTLFTPDMSGLHLALFQLSVLIHKFIPRLSKQFDSLNVTATMYASQWFLTLFSYSVPLQLVFRFYDLMFAEGIMVILMRVSVALLKRNEKKLLEFHDLESILGHLKGNQLLEIYDSDFSLLLEDTITLSKHITILALEELRDKYCSLIRYVQEEQKCAVAVTKRELEFMKSQLLELQTKVNKGETKIKELQTTNLELQDSVFKYKQKLTDMDTTKQQLQKENEFLKKKIADLEAGS